MTDQNPQHHDDHRDDDPAAALADRMIAGEDVTEDDAIDAERQASGRRLFAAARQKVADHRAAVAEREDHARRQAAADQDARDSLARTSPAALAAAYDDVARVVAALVAMVDDRNTTVGRLTSVAGPDRPSGASDPDDFTPHVVLDDHVEYRRLDLHQVLAAALAAGGVQVPGPGQLRANRATYAPDPEVVALGRDQAA
ncbi:hypothetical protein [Actinomycetospora flava]|uniref:Nucleotide exchange factor GrpE n=1 Tax=Actinomycetospora flava TaxID=3129232 RepID=A0ABU8MGM7_9PSEU